MKYFIFFICIVFFIQASYSETQSHNKAAKQSHSEGANHTDENTKLEDHHQSKEIRKTEKKDENSHEKHDEVSHDHEGKEAGDSNPQVGVDKGIIEANAEKGFKISPEALLNFEVKTHRVNSKGSIEVPENAIVYAGPEVNLFRLRDSFYKRIDFKKISQKGKIIFIKSSDLLVNDEVVTIGIEFLRIAELAAFGGAPEGHSH